MDLRGLTSTSSDKAVTAVKPVTREVAAPPDVQVVASGARLRVRVGAVVVLVLLGLTVAVAVSMLGGRGQSTVIVPSSASTQTSNDAAVTTAGIYVHVLGAVTTPGLYALADGARGVDAVAAAGGFTADADRAQLNLARFISDGEQVYVPLIGEVPAAQAAGGVAGDGRVNLNTADAAALETLPRVGPAMAARILDWRETNGRFATVEDLRSVSGIGEKTFAALKDLVSV